MEKIIELRRESQKKIVTNTEKYWVHTNDGKLLDLQMGNSAFIFGYSDKDIIQSINNNNIRFVKNGEDESSEEIKKVVSELLSLSNMSALSWSVSGTDAIETGLSIAFHFWEKTYKKRNKILSLLPCYHGASWLTRALRSEVKNEFCKYVKAPCWITNEEKFISEKNTLEKIEVQFKTDEVGSIILESIPWVSGVYPFSNNFWNNLSNLCKKYSVLLILDDVAGCFGKLGKPFTNTTLNMDVDILCIGKSMSGGYSPIGAALINQKVFDCIGSMDWTHTYTFNPNMSGILATKIVLEKVKNGIFDNIDSLQNRMCKVLKDNKIPYRHLGMCFDIITDTKKNSLKFKDCGFSFNVYNDTSIPIVLPIIADDEYFAFVEEGLSKIDEI